MADILFVDSGDHNAYPDAATPEIKDEMVEVSDAVPRDFNQEQVRTNLYFHKTFFGLVFW